MATTDTLQRPAAAPGGDEDQDQDAVRDRVGKALDIAGICAGVVLGVILFDIVSGGKLTNWARNRRGSSGPAPAPASEARPADPCVGCGDDD